MASFVAVVGPKNAFKSRSQCRWVVGIEVGRSNCPAIPSPASSTFVKKKKSGKNEKTTRAYDEQENMRNEKNEEKARQSLHDGI